MIQRIIASLLSLSFVFSFNTVDGFDVIENSVVIKFSDTYAPKLGQQPAIELKKLRDVTDLLDDLTIVDFKTLFLGTEDFGPSEYKHFLHHYSSLKLENPRNLKKRLPLTLK